MIILFVALGCIKGSGSDSGEADSGEMECGSTDGFVSGTVTSNGGNPVSVGTVKAYPNGDEEGSITTATSSDGSYELNLGGGIDWVLTAWDSEECYASDVTLSVVECTEEVVDFTLDDCVTADKPNLYLYPDEPTRMRVGLKLDPKQRVVASEPVYDDGWRGTAWPDGTWTQDGERFDFLFYELSLAPWQHESLRSERGVCAADLAEITELVRAFGFNEREVSDFYEGWVEDLPHAEQYAVYPQRHVRRMAGLEIEPEMRVERLWLVVEPAPTCTLEGFEVHPLDRSGAHGVEWGVVLEGFQRTHR